MKVLIYLKNAFVKNTNLKIMHFFPKIPRKLAYTPVLLIRIKSDFSPGIIVFSSAITISSILGYEPAGLTVHPPQNDRGWVHFFRMGSSVTKIFSSKKSGFCRRYSHWNAPKRGFTS